MDGRKLGTYNNSIVQTPGRDAQPGAPRLHPLMSKEMGYDMVEGVFSDVRVMSDR